jgi:putative alpha-1,2-mannosidase
MYPFQYAFQDFGIRQVAQVLGKTDDVEYYTNRSYVSAQ